MRYNSLREYLDKNPNSPFLVGNYVYNDTLVVVKYGVEIHIPISDTFPVEECMYERNLCLSVGDFHKDRGHKINVVTGEYIETVSDFHKEDPIKLWVYGIKSDDCLLTRYVLLRDKAVSFMDRPIRTSISRSDNVYGHYQLIGNTNEIYKWLSGVK